MVEKEDGKILFTLLTLNCFPQCITNGFSWEWRELMFCNWLLSETAGYLNFFEGGGRKSGVIFKEMLQLGRVKGLVSAGFGNRYI